MENNNNNTCLVFKFLLHLVLWSASPSLWRYRCQKFPHLYVFPPKKKDAPSEPKLPRGPRRALQFLLACCGALIARQLQGKLHRWRIKLLQGECHNVEEKQEHPPTKDGGAAECLQWSAVRGGKSWTERICKERRCAGKNVGTNSCTFPNLQPIDWL